MNKTKDGSAFKAGIGYTLSNFFIRGISIITMPIFTRLMTKGEVGDFSAFTGWISILSVIVTLNLGTSVIIAKYDFGDKYDKFCSSISFLGFISSAVVYLVLLVFKKKTLELLGISSYELHVMFLYFMFMPSIEIILGKFRTELKYKQTILISVASTVFATLGALVCVYMASDRLMGRVLGTYIPQIGINIGIFIYLLYKGRSISSQYWKYALTISVPLIIHHLSGNIVTSSDRIMIQRMCSSEDAAIYSVAFMCGLFANIVRNSMDAAWTPWVFEQINNNQTESVKKYGRIYILAFFFVCVIIILFAPEILRLLGGNGYLEAKYVVPPVVGGYMFSMLYCLYGGIERYYKKQKWFALFAIITASINVVLNVVFIRIFGYIAAAYTTLVSCAVELILHYINTRRMGFASYYDGKFTLKISFSIALTVVASELVYLNDIVRWLIILFVSVATVVAAVIYRNTISLFINTHFLANKRDALDEKNN